MACSAMCCSARSGATRRSASRWRKAASEGLEATTLSSQGKKYVENDDDDDDDEQRVLHATEVASVDIVPMRKQRQRFSIGGSERNIVLHRGAVSHMVRTQCLLLHLIVTSREWLLLDDAAWSRRGRVDGAHHATMATLRRRAFGVVLLVSRSRSTLSAATWSMTHHGRRTLGKYATELRGVRLADYSTCCNRTSLSGVCGACVDARRCGRCCRSGWCKSSLSFSMTSRTCCSRDSHRDAALTTANNQLFQMRDPLRYRFDSLIKTTHNARRIRRRMEGFAYLLSLSLNYNPLVRQ